MPMTSIRINRLDHAYLSAKAAELYLLEYLEEGGGGEDTAVAEALYLRMGEARRALHAYQNAERIRVGRRPVEDD
jgi:hypothetical protein